MPQKSPTIGSVNDISTSVEFLMVALREIVSGAPIEDKQVQQNIDFALRLVLPLSQQVHFGTGKGHAQGNHAE